MLPISTTSSSSYLYTSSSSSSCSSSGSYSSGVHQSQELPPAGQGRFSQQVADLISGTLQGYSKTDSDIAQLLSGSLDHQAELNDVLSQSPNLRSRINESVQALLHKLNIHVETKPDGHVILEDTAALDTQENSRGSVLVSHTEGEPRVIGSGTIEVGVGGRVKAMHRGTTVYVGPDGYAEISKAATATVDRDGTALVLAGGYATLTEGATGLVEKGGAVLALPRSEVRIYSGGSADIHGGQGRMSEPGSATVSEDGGIVASNGVVDVFAGGFAEASDKAKININNKGSGYVSHGASAQVKAGGQVIVGKMGTATIKQGGQATVKADGQVIADQNTFIKLDVGARIKVADPDMVVNCGANKIPAKELQNFATSGEDYIQVTEQDCRQSESAGPVGASGSGRRLAPALPKAPPRISPRVRDILAPEGTVKAEQRIDEADEQAVSLPRSRAFSEWQT